MHLGDEIQRRFGDLFVRDVAIASVLVIPSCHSAEFDVNSLSFAFGVQSIGLLHDVIKLLGDGCTLFVTSLLKLVVRDAENFTLVFPVFSCPRGYIDVIPIA
jgi:hypothetical protein